MSQGTRIESCVGELSGEYACAHSAGPIMPFTHARRFEVSPWKCGMLSFNSRKAFKVTTAHQERERVQRHRPALGRRVP